MLACFRGRVSIDLGTGDGRLPHSRAREAPERLFVGVDPNAAGLRALSGRALRDGLDNLAFVRAAVEDLPAELAGVADHVTVVLPWGSLLGAVLGPSAAGLRGIRGLCRTGAMLEVLVSVDPLRDRAEIARLGLPPLAGEHVPARLAELYAAAGFGRTSVRELEVEALARWPSSWARRLAHGRPRPVLHVTARAS